MIDLPTQKDIQHPHHQRAVFALIATGVIFAGLIAAYVINPKPGEPANSVQADPAAEKMAELAKPNPLVVLSPQQIVEKKAALAEKNPKVNLTPEQVKAKRMVLENI